MWPVLNIVSSFLHKADGAQQTPEGWIGIVLAWHIVLHQLSEAKLKKKKKHTQNNNNKKLQEFCFLNVNIKK